jgi:hypothetical protein
LIFFILSKPEELGKNEIDQRGYELAGTKRLKIVFHPEWRRFIKHPRSTNKIIYFQTDEICTLVICFLLTNQFASKILMMMSWKIFQNLYQFQAIH